MWITRESYQSTPTSLATKQITNTYDTGTNGRGRLTRSTRGSVSTTYIYNQNATTNTTSTTINGTIYPTSYTYNLQSNPLTVKLPNNSVVTHTYGHQGDKSITHTNGTSVQIDRNHLGMTTKLHHNNGENQI